jgi:hypothetical protein
MIPNQLAALYWQQMMTPQQGAPQNMLASNDFDPNSIVGRMLAAERAKAAAQAAQAQKAKPQPRPQPPYGVEPAETTLQRRMREAGL